MVLLRGCRRRLYMREPSASRQTGQKPLTNPDTNSNEQCPTRDNRNKSGLRLGDLDNSQRSRNQSTAAAAAVLPVASLAARTAAKAVPNSGNGQDRFAIDGYRFAVYGFCVCVLNYRLEDFCKLRFAFRCNWRFHRIRHSTRIANVNDGGLVQHEWSAMGLPIQAPDLFASNSTRRSNMLAHGKIIPAIQVAPGPRNDPTCTSLWASSIDFSSARDSGHRA